MDRTILHVDANSFFASVECAMDPTIKDKPVAVVGDASMRRGIVLAANYIAKTQYGIKTAEAIWQAERKCPDLIKRRADMKSYKLYSQNLRDILLSYSDYVEPFGCDEAWVELRGMLIGKGIETANAIRVRVKRELDITVSVGVSFNKAFAKLGSDIKKPDAVTEITREDFKEKIWTLPVENLLYVGKKTRSILNRRAVFTIGDLAKSNPELLTAWLGKNGQMLYEYANGMDTTPVAVYDDIEDEKSISSSTTCPRDITTRDEVKAVFITLADEIAERLRSKKVRGKEISIKIRDNELKWSSHGGQFDIPTDISREIAQYAMKLFDEVYSFKKPIRSLGIGIGSLKSEFGGRQMDLWGNDEKRSKLEKIDRVGDTLKKQFGHKVLFSATNIDKS